MLRCRSGKVSSPCLIAIAKTCSAAGEGYGVEDDDHHLRAAVATVDARDTVSYDGPVAVERDPQSEPLAGDGGQPKRKPRP
jgi:hypothetical protein